MSETIQLGVLTRLTPSERLLVADAIALLWITASRRKECMQFARDHPELGLIHGTEEPTSEEDR